MLSAVPKLSYDELCMQTWDAMRPSKYDGSLMYRLLPVWVACKCVWSCCIQGHAPQQQQDCLKNVILSIQLALQRCTKHFDEGLCVSPLSSTINDISTVFMVYTDSAACLRACRSRLICKQGLQQVWATQGVAGGVVHREHQGMQSNTDLKYWPPLAPWQSNT